MNPGQTLSLQQLEQLSNSGAANSRGGGNQLGSPFLRTLANVGRDTLAKVMDEIQIAPGELVFAEGEPGNAMFIIRSGRVVVLKGSLDAPTVLGYRSAGEIIGEMALLENEPRSASVVALEPVRVLSITRSNFEQLIGQNPALGLSILSTLSARLRAADDARKSSSTVENTLSSQVSRLQDEKQQLMELERLRQDTIDLIVHDLRHPISSLFGAIKILEMVLPEEVLSENQQLLDIANSNCDHLQLMVESMLDIAQMETGQFKIHRRSADLPHMIAEAIKRIQVVLDMENIQVEINLPPGELVIMVDEEKIYRVLGNLLNNALKYSPTNGKIVVTVELQAELMVISVTDQGPGVPPESRQAIFNRFVKLSDNRPRVGGFGLGLSFCKMAVEGHDGQIWVEDGENGNGSRFVFTLPLHPTP